MSEKVFFAKWWEWLVEPRRVTFAMCIAYALIIYQGIGNIIHPGIEGIAFDWLRMVINAFLIVGGLLGLIAAPRGLWLFEKPAMIFIVAAYVAHWTWVIADFDHDGVIEQGKVTRIAICLILFYTRYERIRGARVDPKKS